MLDDLKHEQTRLNWRGKSNRPRTVTILRRIVLKCFQRGEDSAEFAGQVSECVSV